MNPLGAIQNNPQIQELLSSINQVKSQIGQGVSQGLGQMGNAMQGGQQMIQGLGDAIVPGVQAVMNQSQVDNQPSMDNDPRYNPAPYTGNSTRPGGYTMSQRYSHDVKDRYEPQYSQYVANPNATTLQALVNPSVSEIQFGQLPNGGWGGNKPYTMIQPESGYAADRSDPNYNGWYRDIWGAGDARPPYPLQPLDVAMLYQQALLADKLLQAKTGQQGSPNKQKFLEIYNNPSWDRYSPATWSEVGFQGWNGMHPVPKIGNPPWHQQ